MKTIGYSNPSVKKIAPVCGTQYEGVALPSSVFVFQPLSSPIPLQLTGQTQGAQYKQPRSFISSNIVSPKKLTRITYYKVHTYKEPYYYFVPGLLLETQVESFISNLEANASGNFGVVKVVEAYLTSVNGQYGTAFKLTAAVDSTVEHIVGNLAINAAVTLSVDSIVQSFSSDIVRIGQATKNVSSHTEQVNGEALRLGASVKTVWAYTDKVNSELSRQVNIALNNICRQVASDVIKAGFSSKVVESVVEKAYASLTRQGGAARTIESYINNIQSDNYEKLHGVRIPDTELEPIVVEVDTWYPPERKKLLTVKIELGTRTMNLAVSDRRIEVRQVKECQLGNTARFSATFRNWDGAAMDPVEVVFRIVSSHQDVLFEQTLTVEDNRKAVGSYFIDYVPTKTGNYIFEWYAVIDGTPAVKRGNFMVKRTLL